MLINSSQPQPQPPYVSLLVYQSTLTFANPRETISKKNPSTSTTRDPRKNISPPHHFFKLFLKKAERFTNVWWARSLSIYYIMTCKDNNKVPCGGRYRTMTRSEHTHPRLILVMLLSVCLFSFGISSHCQAFTTTTTTTTIAFSNIIRRRNAVSVSVSSSSCLSMIASSSTKVAAGLLQELPERGPDGVYHILTPDQHKYVDMIRIWIENTATRCSSF